MIYNNKYSLFCGNCHSGKSFSHLAWPFVVVLPVKPGTILHHHKKHALFLNYRRFGGRFNNHVTFANAENVSEDSLSTNSFTSTDNLHAIIIGYDFEDSDSILKSNF